MRSRRSSNTWFLGFAVFSAAVVISLYGSPREVSSADRETYESLENFNNILALVRDQYVDEVEAQDLVEGAIQGMVSSLDPHSAYLTPKAFEELKIETSGEFGGLGIEITVKDDILTIITPMDGTPAFRAGVQPGDRIVKIDDAQTRDISLQKAVDMMRGKPGSKVRLTLHRDNVDKLIEVPIVREVIHIRSVRGTRLIDDSFGYLRLTQFQENSAEELAEGISTLKEEAGGVLKGLVLDLRYNPGGLLNEAIKVSNLFLDAGTIVSTGSRMENQKRKYFARSAETFEPMPMVVLVNGGSASASEIVAGALLDHQRALVVGTKSFGKGSVQTILQLPQPAGAALRLTTARYYTPSGVSIQDQGIMPDVVVELPVIQVEDAEADAEAGDGEEAAEGSDDSEKTAKAETKSADEDEFVLEDDIQLLRAVELLRTWKGDIIVIGGVAGFDLPVVVELAKADVAVADVAVPDVAVPDVAVVDSAAAEASADPASSEKPVGGAN
jgi:carboxyl-terminal processing protease